MYKLVENKMKRNNKKHVKEKSIEKGAHSNK